MYFLRIFILLLVLLSPSAAFSLNIGVEDTDYSPYFFLNEHNQYQGAAREVIDLFIRTEKLSATYSPMPVPRLFSEFERGKVDFKFPDNPLWSASYQQQVKVYYSKAVLPVNESVLTLPKNQSQEVTSIGKFIGFSIPGIQEQVDAKGIELIEAKSLQQLIRLLVSARVDAIYFNQEVAQSLTRELYPEQSIVVHPDFKTFAYGYHLSSIHHPDLIAKFDKFLIKHSEAVSNILKGYGLRK